MKESAEEATVQLDLRMLRAEQFNRLQKADKRDRRTVTIAFNLQQNLPLPKTNIGEAFYQRQLWLYNLGFVWCGQKQNSKSVHLYSWLENQSGRGCNEIISALFCFLRDLTSHVKRQRYSCLSLYADSCPGQNKNTAMMLALLLYMNSTECPFKTIKFTFPVCGHSFMEPGQVFGRIKKDVRKYKLILTPATYREIFRDHGFVREFGTDWRSHDYKKLVNSMIKKNEVPIRNTRRWLFQKNKRTVGCSSTYRGKYVTYDILKPGSGNFICGIRPPLLPLLSKISEAKKNDVRTLLSILQVDQEIKSMYDTLLT